MKGFFIIALFAVIAMASAQRPFYAGLNPIGYPELADRFKTDEDDVTTPSLANRIGEDGQVITTTTMRLPVDARGDQKLVDRISKWPVDKQPYWYINWKLIEQHRAQRPTVAPEYPGNAQNSQNFAPRPQQQPAQNWQNFAPRPQQQPAQNWQNFAPRPQQQPAQNTQNFAPRPQQQPAQNTQNFAPRPERQSTQNAQNFAARPQPQPQSRSSFAKIEEFHR